MEKKPTVILLWEVRGRTGTAATCTLEARPSRACHVTIRMGEQEIVSETWPDIGSAQVRATQILGELVEKGWLLTYSREDLVPDASRPPVIPRTEPRSR